MDVLSFSEDVLEKHLGKSNEAKYIYKYLSKIKAQTIVIENKYVDKDYLIDYSKFYSRSFKQHGRFTNRIHFFTGKFSEHDLKKSLLNEDNLKYFKDRCGEYLGFSVVKPITDEDNNNLIGRTILKNYDEKEGSCRRIFIKQKYHASLYGIPLEVESFPSQVQDNGVSGCGTIALWSLLNPLHNIFGVPKHSPAEITEIASALPSRERTFPSDGLYLNQVSRYLKTIGLDFEPIKVDIDEYIVPTVVKAYINAGLPLLGDLEIKYNESVAENHLVTVSGYRCDENHNLKEIYVHDDRIGPYSQVTFKETPETGKTDFRNWINEWVNDYGGSQVILKTFIVPVYPKIRLMFDQIYIQFNRMKKEILANEWTPELLLYSINDYKRELIELKIEAGFENKEKILTSSLPHFIWVIRAHIKGVPVHDTLYDGTAVYLQEVEIED